MKQWRRHFPEFLLALLLALPWFSLFALGLLWLWQNGRVLEWALAAAALSLLGIPLRVLARRRAEARMANLLAGDYPQGGWNTEESEAWAKVVRLAAETPALDFEDRARAEALAWQTVELVARQFHPTQADPMARVTLPEALLLTEQVSQRLRRWVVQWPGAGRVKISDALWAQRMMERYGFTLLTAYGVAEKAWRALRFAINPIQAAAQEAQRFAVGTTGSMLGDNMRQKVTTQLIHETGRAAIDLYSGRLRLSSIEMAALARADAAGAEAEPPPRLLLVGQAGAGKTALLNALAGAARGHVGAMPSTGPVHEHLVVAQGRPALNIADMPPLTDPALFLREAERADMILWVCAATQPGRGPDSAGFEALRGWAGGQKKNRIPPVFVAMTQSDRLRPAAEWAPPYALDPPSGAKATSIAAARDAVAALLLLPQSDVIPVGIPQGGPSWNLEPLWARISESLETARLARQERLLEQGGSASLRTEAGRALGKGWDVVKTLLRK